MACHNTVAGASETPGPYGSPFSGSESRSSSNSRKRPLGSRKGDDEEMQSGRDGSEDLVDPIPHEGGSRKRTRIESYPCPFRKRNPYRFNCREWEYCAKAPFKSISELKKHVLKYHQQQDFAYKCIRCHAGFARVEELHSHMRVDLLNMCELRPGPPPDIGNEAVSLSVSNQLRSRQVHFDWISLWQTLFPDDQQVPEPDFEPIVELHEVEHEVQTALPAFQTQLDSTLETLLHMSSNQDTSQLHHLLGSTLENLFREFLSTTFSKAQAHAAEPSQSHSATLSDTPRPQPRTRRPSVATSTRPSSLTSITERSSLRHILPNANTANRLSVWSSTESTDTSPSSSFRYSTSTFGQSQRMSMVESVSTEGSLPLRVLPSGASMAREKTPMKDLVLLENKRQRELKDSGMEGKRDSGVADLGCMMCANGLLDLGPCQCASGSQFDVLLDSLAGDFHGQIPPEDFAAGDLLWEISGDSA